MAACYIDDSFPAMLFMLYKYADSVEKGILANANAGGENVARGSVFGAILGAAHGTQGWPKWLSMVFMQNIISFKRLNRSFEWRKIKTGIYELLI